MVPLELISTSSLIVVMIAEYSWLASRLEVTDILSCMLLADCPKN